MIVKKKWLMFLLLLPGLLLYTIPFILPAFVNLPMSMFRWNGITAGRFIGVVNFQNLFTDPLFYLSIRNIFIILIVRLIVTLPIAFLLAVLMRRNFLFNNIFRAIYYIPGIVAPMISTLVWGFIYNPQYGLINNVLTKIGLSNFALNWLGTKNLSIFAICLVAIWGGVGFYLIILLAGMRTIPIELYEAAEIDGASSFRRAISITLPLIKQQIGICIVLVMISSVNTYEHVKFLTNGGPLGTSEVLATYVYKQGFQKLFTGYGMSASVIGFVLCLILSFIYIRTTMVKD